MADNNDILINGDSTELDHPPPHKPDTDSVINDNTDSLIIDDLKTKIDSLQKQNSDLNSELGILRTEKESESKAAAAIAKRASELEGEVSRLQHDLITSMNEGEESNKEIQQLKVKIRELESKLSTDQEVIEELKRDKKAAEESVGKLELMLEDSKSKIKAMEDKMEELLKRSEESEKLVGGLLMEKVEQKEREAAAEEEETDDKTQSRISALKPQLPLIGAVSVSVVAAAMALCYIRHTRN